MNVLFGICALVSAAGAGDLLSLSPLPENVPTFVIEMKDGETLYGAIKVDNAWAESVTDVPTDAYQIQVYFDTPWHYQTHWDLTGRTAPPDYQTIVENKVARYSRETNVRRRARHETGWREAGFELLDTANGLMPVPKKEVELARRAKALAKRLEERTAPGNGQATETPEPEVEAANTLEQGGIKALFAQWWPHALALGIGLLLLAAVVKTFLLG